MKKITIVRFITALCAHKIVTLTEMTANDYKRKFHLPSDKVSYIYNSIGEDVIKNRSDYDENSKTILSVGRFSPEKGYDILIDIAEQVFEKYEDWNWVIYGDGDTFSQIKQEIENRDLDNKIILKGQVKDVSKIYRNAAFFVLTSLREGLPLVLLEAKANHIPCLSFDVISGPREIIRNEVDGFLISPYDKEKMIQCIEKLICNDSLRKNMSLEADSNLDLFDEKIIMQKWNALIDQL